MVEEKEMAQEFCAWAGLGIFDARQRVRGLDFCALAALGSGDVHRMEEKEKIRRHTCHS